MPETKPVLTQDEVVNCMRWHVQGSGAPLLPDTDWYALARRIEAAVIAKRDAQWREAADDLRCTECHAYVILETPGDST